MEKNLNTLSPAVRMALFSLPFVLIVMGFYFYSKPYTYVVRGEAAIVCDNEMIYPALPNDITAVNALYASFENGFNDSSIREADLKARKLCAYGLTHDFIPFRPAPEERNYTVRLGTSVPVVAAESNGEVTLSRE